MMNNTSKNTMSRLMKSNYNIITNRILQDLLPQELISHVVKYLDTNSQKKVRYKIGKILYYNSKAEIYKIVYDHNNNTYLTNSMLMLKYDNKYYILMRDVPPINYASICYYNTSLVALHTYNFDNNSKYVYIDGLCRYKHFIECTNDTLTFDKFSMSMINVVKNLKDYPCISIRKSKKNITVTPKSLLELAAKNWT